MTAPTPSPQEFAAGVVVHLAAVAIAMRSPEQGSYTDAMKVVIREAVAARDASLTAPLREEVERLTKSLTQTDDDLRVALYGAEWGYGRAHEQRIADVGALKSRAERAEAENARLRAALQPFAEDAAYFDACHAPDESSIHAWVVGRMPPRPRKDVTVGHLRAAARALAEGGKSEAPSGAGGEGT